MRLQFIGCGDAFGSGGRFNTCLHLVGRDVNALIDCGASSLVALNRLGVRRQEIDAIFVTHFHPDHFGGLPFFVLDADHVLKRQRELTIAGPPGLRARYAALMACNFPGFGAPRFPLTLQELEIGRRRSFGAVAVTPFHVVHDDRAGPCLGYRFEAEGKVLAFSGDTQWTEALIELGRDADLFVCEGYMREREIKSHMSLALLARHLDRIRPRRLVITHMSNDVLQHQGEVPFEKAEDGMVVEL